MGWRWTALLYSILPGHLRPHFVDHDGCDGSQILVYFANYIKFSAKNSLMAASPNFWYWRGLCSRLNLHFFLNGDGCSLRKWYRLFHGGSAHVLVAAPPARDFVYIHLLPVLPRLAKIDYSLCLPKHLCPLHHAWGWLLGACWSLKVVLSLSGIKNCTCLKGLLWRSNKTWHKACFPHHCPVIIQLPLSPASFLPRNLVTYFGCWQSRLF